jgi:DNA replication protein
MTTPFKGFSDGKSQSIPLHAQFFSEVLPLVDDLAELKIVLFCYWALQQKQGDYRYLRRRDFAQDATLLDGLTVIDTDTDALLNQALAKTVAHGILLVAEVELDTGKDALYFLNTAIGRTAVQQIKIGNWQPSATVPIEILPARPTIYTLYEENIGPLTAGIAERLKAAEEDYPYQWIVEAINIAIESNARRWKYISTILESWKREGRKHGSDEALERTGSKNGRDYTGGAYADFVES